MVVNSSRGGGCKDTWVLGRGRRTWMKTRSLASRATTTADRGHDLGGARPRARQPDPRGRAAAARDGARAHLPAARSRRPAALPLVMPPLDEDAIEPLLDRLDGICLSGGPDLDPAPYEAEPHPELGPIEPDLDRFELAVAAPRRRPRDADPGDLPRHPGAQRRPRRHPAPAPARHLDRDRPPPDAPPATETEPPGRGRARAAAWRRSLGGEIELDGQLLPPPGDRPARRGPARSAPGRPTARSRRSRTRAGAS